MAKVKLSEMELAYDFLSFDGGEMNSAYVSKETGKIYWQSDEGGLDELPEDFDESDEYVAIPHRNDLDLGRRLVDDFVLQELPEEYDRVRSFFQRRGAYARYKDLLETKGLLDAWHKYENERTQHALKQWCEDNGIEILDPQPETTE